MKKILVVVFAVVVMLGAAQVNAQVPYVQVYFDEYWQTSVLPECPMDPPGSVVSTLYVVAHNFNMWMNGIEYMISYPTELTWLGDSIGPDRLSIGNSPTGIGITWPIPGNGFGGILAQTANVLWMCQGCDATNITISVLKHPSTPCSGPDCANLVRAVRWPDLGLVFGVGMTSVVCPVIPVQETTWGGIKAQYND